MVTENNNKGFADRLNEKLDEAGAPSWDKGRQQWVADFFKKEFKISAIGVRKWMIGEGMPDTKKLDVIAVKLKTSVNYLLSGNDNGVKEAVPRYKADRLDLHADLDSLQPDQVDEFRLLWEYIKFRKTRKVTAEKRERKRS